MIRTGKTRYLLTHRELQGIGEAYYYCIRDNSTQLTKTALKVLLLIDDAVKYRTIPFLLSAIPYKEFWCRHTMMNGLRELAKFGYIDRPGRYTYKLNDKGTEFVKLFWYNHSRRFAKLVSDKSV